MNRKKIARSVTWFGAVVALVVWAALGRAWAVEPGSTEPPSEPLPPPAATVEVGGSGYERLCGLPDTSGLVATAQPTPAGHATYQEWIANDTAQAELRELHRLADERADQLLGVAADHAQQRFLVIVDPAQGVEVFVDVERSVRQVPTSFEVAVVEGCHPLAEIRAVEAELARSGALGGDGTPYGYGRDPSTGTVTLIGADLGDVERATDRLGSLVDGHHAPELVNYAGSRDNDSNPHWGDANVDGCSSNFAFNGFIRIQMTAAHCFDNGEALHSGGQFYGTTFGENATTGDYIGIYADGQSYTNVIHTTPCCPSSRTVVAKVNTANGSFVCAGGRVSLSDCGAEVYNDAAQVCNPGCHPVQWARRPATQEWICEPGDSGGVVYQRSGSSNALAAGMIQGGIGRPPEPVYGYYVCFFETVSHIESASGLTLATTK